MSSEMTWRPAFPEPPVKTMRFPEGAIVENLGTGRMFLYVRDLIFDMLVVAWAWGNCGVVLTLCKQKV